MGLETGSYIADLVASNPAASDAQSQGDDHLRLMKTVLQACFPNASKAFRFPADVVGKTSNYTVVFPDDQNKIIPVSAASGAVTITMPVPSGVNAPGWMVTIVKSDSTANVVTISAASIAGATTYPIRVPLEGVTLVWLDAASTWIPLPYLQNFAASTKMLFVQTTAPAGWTKITTYNDRVLRLVSGTASVGGNIAFGNALKSHTLTQANLPSGVTLTSGVASAQDTVTVAWNTSGDTSTSGGGARVTTIVNGGSSNTAINVSMNHTHQVSLGGSSDPLRLDVQYVDVIYASKD